PITPVTAWKTAADMGSGDWAEVTMVKFVANAEIISGASGETTFRVAVDPDAPLGQTDFWRSYHKAWRLDGNGDGTWNYGSVVAAETAQAGIQGMLFFDANNNGSKDNDPKEQFDNSAPSTAGVTALLTGANITPLYLTMNPDGSFSSPYVLKPGAYTVTFTNNTPGYLFTANTPSLRSDGENWRMDVRQADIAADQRSCTYTFTVDANNSSITTYIGLGLRTTQSDLSYSYKVEHYTVDADGVTVTLINTKTLSGAKDAAVTAAPESNLTGYTYDPNFPGTVAGGTVAEDGSLVLKLYYQINRHNIIYSYTGAVPAGAPAAPAPELNVPYNAGQTLAAAPVLAGYTFSGWSTASNLPSGVNGGNFRMPDNDLLFTGQWTPSDGGGGGGGSSNSGHKDNQVIYHANNGLNERDVTDNQPPGAKVTVKPGDIFTAPANKVFAGWSDQANGAVVYQPGDIFTMPAKGVDLYAVWVEKQLNTADHFAYIFGYPDGRVHPAANITRAEVAEIFYRLLTQDSRKSMWQTRSGYSDVPLNQWFDNAIATLAKGGILEGYPDGTFHPGAAITRAEFASIAARFATGEPAVSVTFSDVNGHWAADGIYRAAELGWVTGYPDGTFRPNQNITRAEVMALVNRVLERKVTSEQDLLSDMKKWPDNSNVNAWYYFDVQEATNSHSYERKSDGIAEKWIALRANPDWKAMEQPDYQP
ncbi:MAG: S-layer homology domain-containing protein, partial [Firmicutes bacterium]|nr:S-layer homology domain-containing protein [Bacillota bacterium]